MVGILNSICWDFKQYVLGALFYRFISENFANHMKNGDESINYATLSDNIITPEIKADAIKTKGYFIYPSQLFKNVVATANTNPNLNTDLKSIFTDIENSATGYPSEQDIKGLFADFDTTSNRLGNTVADKNSRLAAVLKGVAELDFGDFEDNHIDLFGDMKEYQRFSPDSVNGSESTAGLKRNIDKDDNKIIVTTIQKLNNLMKSEDKLPIYDKQVVFIFDECHRSQFGEAQKNLTRKFKKYYQFGFTGTPIFPLTH